MHARSVNMLLTLYLKLDLEYERGGEGGSRGGRKEGEEEEGWVATYRINATVIHAHVYVHQY